jgi:hypothetical protein
MNTADLSFHADHKWAQKSRCVYCETCQVRLYQGKLPPAGEQKEFATSLDKVLDKAREEVRAKRKKEWDERTPEQMAAYEQGKASYVPGESIMDRMERPNPYKGTDLAKWFNMGWSNAEGEHFEETHA